MMRRLQSGDASCMLNQQQKRNLCRNCMFHTCADIAPRLVQPIKIMDLKQASMVSQAPQQLADNMCHS